MKNLKEKVLLSTFISLFGFLLIPTGNAFALCDSGTCYVAGDGTGDFNCDGTNDEVEISAALAYVAANNSLANTVHLKGPHTYMIDGSISIGNFTTLEGDANAVIKLVDAAAWANGVSLIQPLSTNGNHDITIQGFEIDGNSDNQPESRGAGYYSMIQLDKSYNVTVQNMYMHHGTNDGLRVRYASTLDEDHPGNVLFRNNVVYKIGHDALYCIGVNGVEAYGNDVYTRTNSAFRLHNANHAEIYDNVVHGELTNKCTGPGIEVSRSSNGTVDDIEIHHNYIYNVMGDGIWIIGTPDTDGKIRGRNLHIHHNTIYTVGHYWYDDAGSNNSGIAIGQWDDTLIENNIIYNGKHSGIGIYSSPITVSDPINITVRNNIIMNSVEGEGYGIDSTLNTTFFYIASQNNIFYNNLNGSYSPGGHITHEGDIIAYPLFADLTGTDPANFDFHLKSTAGRWNGTAWVTDTVDSPGIDAGYAASDYSAEPGYNGGRINIGRYGNTSEASKSQAVILGYALAVTNGSGDGSYAAGTNVTITANAPALGKVFDRWTGDIGSVSSVTSASTTVTMPAGAISLTATYKDAAIATYVLTVTDGTGDGSYAAGASVTITAGVPASGKVFDKWTGDTSHAASITAATTTVNMPASVITLIATYKDAPVTTYALTVNYGSGDGFYVAGTSVSISANAPAAGKMFDKWTGSTSAVSNVNLSLTTINMPASAITLTATYKDIPTYALAVTGGTGSGVYMEGEQIIIVADAPGSGKVFDKWTGDISHVSNASLASATVTMPANAVSLIATNKDIVDTTAYVLTVNSGAGDGSYIAGMSVVISADAPATGRMFDKWTGDTAYVSNTSLVSATITMPAKAITLTANYINASSGSTGGSTGSSGSSSGGAATILTPKIIKVELTVINDSQITVLSSVTNAAKMMLSDNSGFIGATWETYATTKTTTKKDAQTKLYLKFISSTNTASETVELPLATGSSTSDSTSVIYPTGTLLKTPDSFKTYVVVDGRKKWISTPEVFEQLGYQWTDVTVVTDEQLDALTDYEDNLIRQLGDYKVYLVVNGVRRHIPNPAIFLDYGFKWEEVKDVPKEIIDKYKAAFLVKESGRDGIYFVNSNKIRKLIPTTAIFDSYGDKDEDIQVVSKTELESYALSSLIKLDGSGDIYLIQGTIKKRIPSPAIFSKYRYDWNHVISVNRTEFDYYQNAEELD